MLADSLVLVQTEIAVLGQELMLCRADDLDLIRVRGRSQLVTDLHACAWKEKFHDVPNRSNP